MIYKTIRITLLITETLLLALPVAYLRLKHKQQKIDTFHPLIVFSGAFAFFYLFSHYYYFFSKELFLFNQQPLLAIINLTWLTIAIISFFLGYQIYKKWSPQITLNLNSHLAPRRTWFAVATLSVLAIASFVYFSRLVGGFSYYITHLNKTIPLTRGKMYFIWGILLFKSGFLIHLIYFFNQKLSGKWHVTLLLLHFLLSAGLVFFIGSRLLVLSFLIEVIVFLHYSLKRIDLIKAALITLTIFIIFVVFMGAWRDYGWKREKSSITFFQHVSREFQENLGNRLFNHYIDSVRNFGFVLKYTGRGIPVQYGRTYLALLARPIPNKYRPRVELPLSPSMEMLRPQHGGPYAGIDPLVGELYQNFPILGIPFGLALLGFISGLVYHSLLKPAPGRHFPNLIYGIYVYSIFFWLRGYFVGHTSFILMDLVPLVLAWALIKND